MAQVPSSVRRRLAGRGVLTGFVLRRSPTGAVVALFGLLVSVAPSLLPRPWQLQAVATAVSTLLGYAMGTIVGWAVRTVCGWVGVRLAVDPGRESRVRLVSAAVLLSAAVIGLVTGHEGRSQTARLVGMRSPSVGEDLAALAGAALLLVVLTVVISLVRGLYRGSRFALAKRLPRPLAAAIAMVVVVSLISWLTSSVMAARLLESLSSSAARTNASVPAGRTAPTSPLVSGAPGAAQRWADLGRQGQLFTTNVPPAARIAQAIGRPAQDPIRVYAALTPDLDEDRLADVVVSELHRTGGFERSVLTLINTTGTGWVDEFNVQATEYLTAGDCATATMQYSFLPSFVAFATDHTKPMLAGSALLTKVRAALSELPADKRPKLLVSGESLGSFGGQSAFGTEADMLAGLDGAVWIGTPNFTPLWQDITGRRLPGSPEIAPVVDDGRKIRFLSHPDELTRDVYGRAYGPWSFPRIVYLQHASDPIVWWSPSLAFEEPDWLREPPGRDVNPAIRWFPVITFWMITLDMAVGNSPTAGHGHIYEDELVDTWAAVLGGPPTADRRTEIVAAIRAADRPG